MWLTPDNAHEYVGKELNATKTIFHYYPIKVFQYPDGSYATMDRVGVCSPISSMKINQVWFDMVDGEMVENERGSRL